MSNINSRKTARLLSEVVNPEIGKGGSENRHGFFTIVRDGFFQTDKGEILNKNHYHQSKTFEDDNMVKFEGFAFLMLPTPSGLFFPTFIRLPKLKRAQSEFILEAWKVFKGFSKNDEIVKKVYEAVGSMYSEGLKPDMGLLKLYIKYYYTNLSNKDLSNIGNGLDVKPGLARLDIILDGNLRIQGKLENGEWIDKLIRKIEDVTSEILTYMDNLKTTIRFTDIKNNSLLGINSTEEICIFEYQDGKFSINKTTYNYYIMSGAKTLLRKGVELKNKYNDWRYFSDNVLKFNTDKSKKSAEPDKSLLEPIPETTEKASFISENNAEDKAQQLLDLLNNMYLNDPTIEESMKSCFDI